METPSLITTNQETEILRFLRPDNGTITKSHSLHKVAQGHLALRIARYIHQLPNVGAFSYALNHSGVCHGGADRGREREGRGTDGGRGKEGGREGERKGKVVMSEWDSTYNLRT